MNVEQELQGYMHQASQLEIKETVLLPRELVMRVIKELEHLRSLAGAVTQGESFDDIRKRQGPQPVEDDPNWHIG
jgi:hypothetical protein